MATGSDRILKQIGFGRTLGRSLPRECQIMDPLVTWRGPVTDFTVIPQWPVLNFRVVPFGVGNAALV